MPLAREGGSQMLSTTRFFVLTSFCAVTAGCGGAQSPAATAQSNVSASAASEADASEARPAIVTLLESGSWGWPDGDFSCEGNAVTYRFSDDLRVVTATLAHPAPNVGTGVLESDYAYEVDAIGTDSIRMRMRGEDRRAPDGALVVWDLLVLSHDAFCWHRTDWPEGACTDSLTRCD